MKTKKLLSILLALMMMLSVVPMYASAADPIALTTSNVIEWPTASFKNEAMYYGQAVGDCVLLNGGKVEYNDNVVPGHFEFLDPNAMATSGNASIRADLKFVPDDETVYTGFESKRNRNVTYYVTAVTPLFVDEANDPVVATEVEAGSALSTSTLTGGKLYNPYNADEPNIQSATWMWSSSNTVINESGYHEAFCYPTCKGYNKVTVQVYVRIAGEIPETTIAEAPTVDTLTYDGVTTWGDVELKGGKAVLKIEGTEVAGTFAVTDYWKTRTVNPGSYEIDVVFTPDDPEAALPYSLKIPVTVNKAPIKFVDENGNEVVPEITVPYGTDFNYIPQLLKPYVKGAEYTLISLGDLENTKCTTSGTYTITASAPSDSAHYEKTELSFKLVVEPKALAPKAYSSPEGYYVEDSSGTYRPEGTFDVYIDGKLYKTGVAYLERVAYVPERSGTHEIKFVYKPVENDNFAIENEITATVTVNLTHKLTSSDNVGTFGDFRNGTAIELVANIAAENFAGWKITDAKGNEVTLDGVDNSKTKITITMPDYDIHVEALEKNASSGGSGGIFDMDFGDLSEGDSEWVIINIIRNIIAKFKSFLQQLIETFQSIGD